MASNTPYSLTASDLSNSPDDVVRAVELLQAHGYIVTREPIRRLKATVTLDKMVVSEGDPDSIKKSVRRQLEKEMGTEILTAAIGSRYDAPEGHVSFTATVDVIRPSKGLNSIAEILGG